MLKKISKNMDSYLKSINDPSYSFSDWEDRCYLFGYVDAYFAEEVYKSYILNSLNYENKLIKYDEGFLKGSQNRRKMKNDNPKLLSREEEDWLKKLALNDVLNGIDSRNLKPAAMDIYNFYKTATYSLNDMDFIEKYSSKNKR